MTTPPPGSREAAQALDEAAFEAWLDSVPDSYGISSLQAELVKRYRTLRAALAPPADVAGEVEAIRERWRLDITKGDIPAEPMTKVEERIVDMHNDIFLLLNALSEERARRVEWQPMETAPRDGRYILAIVGKNDSPRMTHLEGRVFAVRPEPFGTGWSVYPGYGGAPSEWFTCWKPLDLPATNKDTQDE